MTRFATVEDLNAAGFVVVAPFADTPAPTPVSEVVTAAERRAVAEIAARYMLPQAPAVLPVADAGRDGGS